MTDSDGELRLTKRSEDKDEDYEDDDDDDDDDDDEEEQWADYPAWGYDKRGLGSVVRKREEEERK